nr:putative nuclease HARBI1 [Misgurnus anguillicaudatus]
MAGIAHRYHRFGGRGYRQRVYVERAQPLEQYTTEELYARFRSGNADIKYIADLVRPKLQRRTRRSHSLSVEQQVLIGLRFYASGTFYQVVGDNIGVDKSTVSDVVKAVSIALASLVNQFVSLPKDVQIAQTKHKFFLLWGTFPILLGLVTALMCISKHPMRGIGSTSTERGGAASTSNLWAMLTSSSQTES